MKHKAVSYDVPSGVIYVCEEAGMKTVSRYLVSTSASKHNVLLHVNMSEGLTPFCSWYTNNRTTALFIFRSTSLVFKLSIKHSSKGTDFGESHNGY